MSNFHGTQQVHYHHAVHRAHETASHAFHQGHQQAQAGHEAGREAQYAYALTPPSERGGYKTVAQIVIFICWLAFMGWLIFLA